MISGIRTNVWTKEIASHAHIGFDVKTFQTKSGHARMKPNARQYSRPCAAESESGKSASANARPAPESNTPAWPSHGSTRYGSRNSGTHWIAISATVCRVTYGVLRRRMRRTPNSRTASAVRERVVEAGIAQGHEERAPDRARRCSKAKPPAG